MSVADSKPEPPKTYTDARFFFYGLGDAKSPRNVYNAFPEPIVDIAMTNDRLALLTPGGKVVRAAFSGGNRVDPKLVLRSAAPTPDFKLEKSAITLKAGGESIMVKDEAGHGLMYNSKFPSWHAFTDGDLVSALGASKDCVTWSYTDGEASELVSFIQKDHVKISYPNDETLDIIDAACGTNKKSNEHIAAFVSAKGGVIVHRSRINTGKTVSSGFLQSLSDAAGAEPEERAFFKKVAVTSQRIAAITESGTVVEALFDGDEEVEANGQFARVVEGLTDVIDIAGTVDTYIAALTASGDVYIWGQILASNLPKYGLDHLLPKKNSFLGALKSKSRLGKSFAEQYAYDIAIWPPAKIACPKAAKIAVGHQGLAVLLDQ